MTVQLDDLLEGAKVSVTWNKEGEEVTREGTVVAANPTMLLIKPRGAMLGELIHRENITELTELTELTKIVIRKLRVIKPTEARQHLVDRHGYDLEMAELESDARAFKHHELLDHSKLSHGHSDKDDSPRAEAIEAAHPDSDLIPED